MKEIVDLRSDTITRPTPGMREAMAKAEVGDDVFGEDPTVNTLQQRCAQLLGKEAALFVPSGTMANLLAACSQTTPGDTVILSRDAHMFHYESGGVARIGGLMTKLIDSPILDPDAVTDAINLSDDDHFSHTTLIEIENTMNRGGGAVYPLKTVQALGAIARENGIRLHCDGARLFNAVIAEGVSPVEYAAPCDTVSFCFSKGLGCPVGSILAGSRETIVKAHRYRKMAGGGMRQAGVLAAAALYALDHHIDRLADDHRRAKQIREAMAAIPGVSFPLDSPTNMVFFDVPAAPRIVTRAAEQGVLAFDVSPTRIRAVFHLDVDDCDMNCAIEAFRRAVNC